MLGMVGVLVLFLTSRTVGRVKGRNYHIQNMRQVAELQHGVLMKYLNGVHWRIQ